MILSRHHTPPRRRRRSAPWLLAAGVLVAAATPATASQPIRFRTLGTDDGLSQSSVLAIAQDGDGFMWFATEAGLNRYDGYTVTRYLHDHDNDASLPHEYVVGLVADDAGGLWIATNGGGVGRWDHATDSFLAYRHDPERPTSLASDLVRAIAVAGDGAVWIGTRDAGVDRLDPATGEVRHFRHDPADPASLADDRVYALLADPGGGIWVGTDSGLDLLDPASGRVTHYRHEPSDPSSIAGDRVRCLLRDRRGRLWAGTYGGGLNRLDGAGGGFKRFQHDAADPDSLGHDRVRAVYEDRAGRLWVGTVAGLDLLEGDGRFSHYRRDPANPESLAGDDVTSIFQDEGGVIWIGSQAAGVSIFNPASWSFGHRAESAADPGGLSNNTVTSISQDPAGRLWVGTFGGGVDILDRASHKRERLRSRPGSIRSDRVMALLHDHLGNAWIGTFDGGLARIEAGSGRATTFRHDPADPGSLPADGVMSLHEAADRSLWIGTFGGGLARFDRRSQRFARFGSDPPEPSSLSSPRITCIADAPDGRLWVGTDGGGLDLFDPATGTARQLVGDPRHLGSLGTDTVLALHVDSAGRLWIGTRGRGLALLERPPETGERPRFLHFGPADGLPDSVVYGIEEDAAGSLWLSTNRGLSRFVPAAGTFQNFDRWHGLQADEFTFGAHFRTPDGELVFGGVNGLNAFYPGSLERNKHVPPVALTSFTTFGRPVATATPLSTLRDVRLGWRDDVVTFEFAALDFAAPERNRYRYRLEGLSDEWIELGTERRITFTDLAGGRYRLLVQAANNDSVWNERGTELALRVAPPPWRTGWAYVSYGVLLSGALVSYRTAHQRRLEREEDYSRRLESEVVSRTRTLADRNRELEDLNSRLVEASLTDSLTGLRNRRFLFEEVAKDIALVRRRYLEIAMGLPPRDVFDVVFVMVDLDNFKEINDTFGHPMGDKVLVQLRDVLLDACRDSDIVIRWGGDEFLIVGRDTDPDRAEALADRIRASIDEHVFTLDEGEVLRTTASVGFACYPFIRSKPDAVSWEQVLTLADEALYMAKNTTRNAWVGLLSTQASAERPDVVQAIRDNPRRVAGEGHLEIRSSISSREWVLHGEPRTPPSPPPGR